MTVYIYGIQNYLLMKYATKTLGILIISFGIYFVLDDLYFAAVRKWIFELINHLGTSHILTYALSGIPLFVGAYLIAGKSSFFEGLGLTKSIVKGFLFALLCTLPMYIGFSFLFDFNREVSLNRILISVISAGFFEELFFRGFLFGLMFRFTKFGFIPSVLFGALYFGILHLYQSNDFSELLGIFFVTFLGAILFSWVYAEWEYNLWVPIFLHILMNLSWELFSVSENALGDLYANLFRLATLVLIILLTVVFKKKKGMHLEINKKNLLLKHKLHLPIL